MRILCLADEESNVIWDTYTKDDFKDIDLIISCGDLKASYLSYIETISSIPILYVHGNHDDRYATEPPEGCFCIEDQIYVYQGVRFLGLGGSQRYKPGINQYTEREMRARVNRMALKLLYHKGFDVLVTHAPALGLNDGTDACHRGFEIFTRLIDKYHPKYFIHGHVHLTYSRQFAREDSLGDTKVINAFEKYIIEI
ncbi:MAG: metallophosphoesterase family protein [Agathobacter sp.]|nr:metallophosphoesterase family protein [Agathobacter sp.]MDY3888640.1 metallophosphoesterase family protein [Agathobacter sp.]